MFCVILCSHRVWSRSLSPNLNPSPAVEISHKLSTDLNVLLPFLDVKQLKWEMQRERDFKGQNWRKLKGGRMNKMKRNKGKRKGRKH